MRFSLRLVVAAFLMLASMGVVSWAAADDADICSHARGDEAIEACTRAINSGRWSGPDLAWAYTSRCNEYETKGDRERAIADCTEAIRLDPKSVLAYYDRGLSNKHNGNLDLAIADFNEAIRLDPKFAQAALARGITHIMKGDLERAIADYNLAIQLDSKYALSYYNRGRAYGRKGDNDRAIADYTEALRLDLKTPMSMAIVAWRLKERTAVTRPSPITGWRSNSASTTRSGRLD
jgi:tetratricopeptide (TPR) repeat protein